MTEQELSQLLETLQPLEPSALPMFGGHGIYSRDVFFAIYHGDRLYFRVDDESRQRYVDAGMGPFAPPGRRISSYYEVPEDVIASPDALREWATLARDAAARR